MFVFVPLFGQNKQPLSVSFLPKTGFLVSHRPIMSHLVKDRNTAFEIEISQQDTRRNFSSTYYRFFSRGVSLHYQDFGYDDVLGRAYSLLQFTRFNLVQRPAFGFLDFRVGSGLAYLTHQYDVSINPKNNAIGSAINAFVNFQLVYTKYFNHFVIGGGLEISHYSNCAIAMPNLGLNTPMCFLKVGYAINPCQVFTPDTNAVIAILPRLAAKFQVHAIGSVRQNLPGQNPSRYLPVVATQFLYRKQIGFKWDLEIGADIIYNAANRVLYDDRVYSAVETIQAGIYGGACANFYKSQLYFGLGGYVINTINPAGWVYNRIGYRYNFNAHFNAMIGIKASLGIADYLEMGIGYRF